MTKYIKDSKGKFAGSIGEGRDAIPTSVNTALPAPIKTTADTDLAAVHSLLVSPAPEYCTAELCSNPRGADYDDGLCDFCDKPANIVADTFGEMHHMCFDCQNDDSGECDTEDNDVHIRTSATRTLPPSTQEREAVARAVDNFFDRVENEGGTAVVWKNDRTGEWQVVDREGIQYVWVGKRFDYCTEFTATKHSLTFVLDNGDTLQALQTRGAHILAAESGWEALVRQLDKPWE